MATVSQPAVTTAAAASNTTTTTTTTTATTTATTTTTTRAARGAIDGSKIVLCGRSLGGAVAVHVAVR